jgi:hypothetical protein
MGSGFCGSGHHGSKEKSVELDVVSRGDINHTVRKWRVLCCY